MNILNLGKNWLAFFIAQFFWQEMNHAWDELQLVGNKE